MEWINVDEKYLDYLRETEERIPYTDYGSDKYKPFFGILFETDDLYYVTQVSHAQDRHYRMKQQKDFFKIYDPKNPRRLIAGINLKYMFPSPKQYVYPFKRKNIHTYRSFKSEDAKSKYIDLLDTEMKVINTMDMENKARVVYNTKCNNPEDNLSKRCIDFKDMERLAKLYNPKKVKNTD